MADPILKLKGLIKAGQIPEARSLLAELGHLSPEQQQAVIELLALASDQTALDLIRFLMETLPQDHEVQDRLFQLATDRAHLNFTFTELLLTFGRPDQIRHIIPLLKHILSKATKGNLLNLILRTAGKLKLTPLTDDVAEFIFFDDAELKKESVKALERMGSRTALKHLEHIASTDKCDLDILDAIEMLREKLGPETPPPGPEITPEPTLKEDPAPGVAASGPDLTAWVNRLASPSLAQRLEAYGHFSENQGLVARALHQHRDTDCHDLMVNLLRLTARTIPQDAVGDLLNLAAQKKMEKSLRFSLLSALAAYPELESAAVVMDLVSDPSMYLRLAAIHVLDRHCSDFIAAEIKSRIETGTKTAEALGISILDAGATRLIDALMTSDTFSYIASNYLERQAPVQAMDAYIQVLENRNRTSTLKKYRQIRLDRTLNQAPVMVVIHTVTAYLNAYVKLIHGSGFEARSFTAPQDAFESIVFQKPVAVVCDLFIRQLSAMDLAREIRELYPRKEVPIIVSTLQRDLDKSEVDEAFDAAGINLLCGFPAKPAQIKTWGSLK